MFRTRPEALPANLTNLSLFCQAKRSSNRAVPHVARLAVRFH
jgi:hypothetical protein